MKNKRTKEWTIDRMHELMKKKTHKNNIFCNYLVFKNEYKSRIVIDEINKNNKISKSRIAQWEPLHTFSLAFCLVSLSIQSSSSKLARNTCLMSWIISSAYSTKRKDNQRDYKEPRSGGGDSGVV